MFQAPDQALHPEPAQNSEVAGVVDHGFDPERPPAFEVGLDSGMPEVGVQVTVSPARSSLLR